MGNDSTSDMGGNYPLALIPLQKSNPENVQLEKGRIIAIDPGGTTGIAVRKEDGEIYLTQLTKPSELWEFLRGYRRVEEQGTIICENFSTAGRISSAGLHTVRLVGGVQAIGWVMGWPVYTPEPAQRIMMREKAEEIAPRKHELRHQRDALMHLLAFEFRRKKGMYR